MPQCVKIPLTVALWAVPRFHKLNEENLVKITCYLPEGLGDTELDDLLDRIIKNHTPIVEVVVDSKFFDSFILFLKDHFPNEEVEISNTRFTPSYIHLFLECLD